MEGIRMYTEENKHVNENLAIQFGFVYGNNEFTFIRSPISDKQSPPTNMKSRTGVYF